jgi:leucine dehydrogenase
LDVIEYMEQWGHEQLVACVDRKAGLRAFIAIHDTTLGPALGGCRVWKYASESEAVTDALRLARAMTYKNAAAGLDLGGGKAVVWADSRTDKSEAMMRAFGRFVESLGGRYVTTEDMGVTPQDMIAIRQETRHVVGLPVDQGGSGDPSRATAFGVYRGIRACAQAAFGSDSLADMRIALQGFGHVASYLAPYLKEERARVTVTDVNQQSLARARELGFTVLEDPDAIYDVPCDIFSPCAMGGVLSGATIPRLQCKVVAGCANNQLLTPEDGEELRRRGIVYAPDYVINAGGVINLSFEMGKPYNEEAAMERVAQVHDAVARVIAISGKRGISTARAADEMAEERLARARP